MTFRLSTVALRVEQDVVTARQRARQIAALVGFDAQDQARIATAVSEIARNAFRYARGGQVEFAIEGARAPQIMSVCVMDNGPGIRDLHTILEGRYESSSGMGIGITGARRLMDQFSIESTPGEGTRVRLKKLFPPNARTFGPVDAARVASELVSRATPSALEELQQQNRELMRALDELRARQEDLLNVNRELEDTNRGVVALYAELDERAGHLRRADEMKSRFLSNMSHEFRTPLNSIRALSRLLLDRSDGPLNDEQVKQVQFIRKAAEDLTELVDDLLDLAKIEAGKIEVHPAEFSVQNLFSALRGMLRPLLVSDAVALRFDAENDLPPLFTDEAKVSQVLRNFISNALKFTERGEIRVSAQLRPSGDEIEFAVADTGIGIAPQDQDRIFEEFTQVAGPIQTRVKGTGLGLPLCRKLSKLLGGDIALESAVGTGSTFTLTIPVRYATRPEQTPITDAALAVEPWRIPVLVVEDDPETQLYYEKILRGTAYVPIAARSLRQAQDALRRSPPAAIVLDVVLTGEDTWRWLAELKSSGPTAVIPVIVATSVSDPRKSYALGADVYLPKPVGRTQLLHALNAVTRARILVIDDDPATRYTMRKLIDTRSFQVLEAANAQEGLRAAIAMQPQAIVLDLNLPDRRGEEVLTELATGAETKDIPVVIATSRELTQSEDAALRVQAKAVIRKRELNRELFGSVLASLAKRDVAVERVE